MKKIIVGLLSASIAISLLNVIARPALANLWAGPEKSGECYISLIVKQTLIVNMVVTEHLMGRDKLVDFISMPDINLVEVEQSLFNTVLMEEIG